MGDLGQGRLVAAALGIQLHRCLLELAVRSISPEEARAQFGFLAGFWSADIPASSGLTRELMGWVPVQPGLVADLEQGHYFRQLQAA